MADVLILSLVFPPDSVSTAEIMGDLASDLVSTGHRVTVLTTVPHYNPDRDAERRQPLERCWPFLLRRSEYHGARVYHAAIPAKGRSVALRLAGWVGFHILSTLAGLFLARRADVIVVPSPPLSSGVEAWLLGAWYRAPFVYNVQEIYPDIAVDLGALRNRWAIRLLSALERFVYRTAAEITVIAPRMRERLMAKGVPGAKLHVIPNFVDLDRVVAAPRDNDFARRFNLDGAFVVSYAGNLGPAQGLDIIVEAAKVMSGEPGIRFVVIGEGVLRGELAATAGALPAGNLLVVPYQPSSIMPQIYGVSDICLVPQAAATGCHAIPSKVYRIMAAGRPVIAITESDSDLAALVEEASCGAVVAPEDSAGLAAVIRQALSDRTGWARKGAAGREYVCRRYSRGTVSAEYDRLVRSLARVR